jgi:hypothetical protein
VVASLDRGFFGTTAAADEEQSVRRHAAWSRIVDAFVDIGILLLAYWIFGVRVAEFLAHTTGVPAAGNLLPLALLIVSVGIIFLSVRGASTALAETGGIRWRQRTRATTILGLLAGAGLVWVGTVPSAIVAPAAVGELVAAPVQVPLITVDWEYWDQWIPGADQGTYYLTLGCSDGRPIGQFRESFALAETAGSHLGPAPADRLGRTNVACGDWRTFYANRRLEAGLDQAASYAWDSLDVSAAIAADGSVEFTEVHRIVFSANPPSTVTWVVGPLSLGDLTDLRVSEPTTTYAVGPDAASADYGARAWQDQGSWRISWWFPFTSAGVPATHTFTIRYRLPSAIQKSDGSQWVLAAPILSIDRPQPIWLATIQVQMPGVVGKAGAQLDNDLDAHQGLDERGQGVFEAVNVPGGTGMNIRVAFPAPQDESSLLPAPTETSTPTPSPTPSPTSTPTNMPSPTHTPTLAPTATRTPSPVPTVTPTDSPTSTPTATDTEVPPTPTNPPIRPRPFTATPRPAPLSTPTPGRVTGIGGRSP